MSHYTGYYGKAIAREELYSLIENGLNLTGTTDSVFMLYDNLKNEDRLFRKYSTGSIQNGRDCKAWDFSPYF